MKRVPDRKNLRREYLRKKGKAVTSAVVAATVFLPSLIACIVFTIGTLICFGYTIFYINDGSIIGVVIAIPCLTFAAITGLMAAFSRMVLTKNMSSAKSLPYVPPVTPDTLPAEEVLVRGAAEPQAPSETLLRAAGTGEETKAEELLRAKL